MAKTVLITGASKGFGRVWAEAFLEKGYHVAATARNVATLADLKAKYGDRVLTLQLDVDRRQESMEVVQQVKQHFGSIDILINNAGYALIGAVEETTEQEARAQMETNFFGTLWLTQAVLPVMREQKSGHIIQVSSILGLAALPSMGLYSASKFAVEGFTEALAAEVKDFGIRLTLVEPNGYASNIWHTGIATAPDPVYDDLRKTLASHKTEFGQVEATASALLHLAETENPPLRLFLGKVALPFVKQAYAEKLELWEAWNELSVAAHG
ncbi:SDR family NAD(P)-dependent oxidoreductase [Sphingobacterium thalpophilum]|uniref:SDR family NAD(P)-dependent oxidoreductase n=1 Tax=Sphingobacterium thalpophilum TaxID=259 RepID=UPI003D967A50